MFPNDSCQIDGIVFTKKSLLERCLEVYWIKASMNLLIGLLIIVIVYPHMLSVGFIRFILLVVLIINILICKRIYGIVQKIDRIFKNGKIITTNIVKEMSVERIKYYLFIGQYKIYSVYYDNVHDISVPFVFKGHSDRPVHLMKGFKQGEELRDLKTINVLVNADDYSEYFVLFREELNIDMSRNRYYQMLKLMDYIIFYGGIFLIVLLG